MMPGACLYSCAPMLTGRLTIRAWKYMQRLLPGHVGSLNHRLSGLCTAVARVPTYTDPTEGQYCTRASAHSTNPHLQLQGLALAQLMPVQAPAADLQVAVSDPSLTCAHSIVRPLRGKEQGAKGSVACVQISCTLTSDRPRQPDTMAIGCQRVDVRDFGAGEGAAPVRSRACGQASSARAGMACCSTTSFGTARTASAASGPRSPRTLRNAAAARLSRSRAAPQQMHMPPLFLPGLDSSCLAAVAGSLPEAIIPRPTGFHTPRWKEL